MNASAEIGTLAVSLIAMLAWLVLSASELRSHKLGMARTVRYGLMWVGIFGVVVLVANRFAS